MKTPPAVFAAKSSREWVLLARLVRPQGRHGEVLADLLTDFPELFSERKRLFLIEPKKSAEPREIDLERHWLHKGRVVLKLAGVDSITDAERLRGYEVAIPKEQRAALDEDAVYIDELLGCQVFDMRDSGPHGPGPVKVGKVIDVDRESTAHPLLVVEAPNSGEEILIPFVKAFLKRVDLDARRIDMDLPGGLLEINAPLTAEERAGREAGDSSADKGEA